MARKFASAEDALKAYPREAAKESLQKAEQQRQEFLERFPLESWPSMPLERYALGQEDSKDTLCYWLEFRTRSCGGMGGGSARKHIIYKPKNKPGWYFDTGTYKNVQDAWEDVRKGFVQAFRKAQEGDWDTIDDIPSITSGSSLRMKALYMYFPDEVLTVNSRVHIRHFLGLLGRPEASNKKLGVVRLNRALLSALRETPRLKDWKTKEFEMLLFGGIGGRHAPRIVKIAPGENAGFWDDCLAGGYICVGYDEIGDLREFDSRESYKARFVEVYGEPYHHKQSVLSRKANELWTLMQLEPGDVVIANKGTSTILAVGDVVEPGYEWKPERAEFRHVVHVKWDTSYVPREIEPQKKWAVVTVASVSPALYQEIIKDHDGNGQPPPDPIFPDISDALKRKGQAILYGPPGTGKTYIARRFAVWWLLQQLHEKNPEGALADNRAFEEAEKRLIGNENAGFLTVITFHASYSYEDFIEGLRPVSNGSGNLVLRLEDGVFKRVCREAERNPEKPYLVVIDEINRANVAKVLGELITLLEKDKRRFMITLPQSKETFTIPPNVYLLGTMNTADRSIKLLDAALRRRFAFLEMMPDLEILGGGRVGNLALDDFLDELNRRIARKEGREKQIGHSFLLEDGEPISEPEEFARRFRQEILPLLQEYCYDDYSLLASYVGEKLVDREAQTLNWEILGDADALIGALEDEFGEPGESE